MLPSTYTRRLCNSNYYLTVHISPVCPPRAGYHYQSGALCAPARLHHIWLKGRTTPPGAKIHPARVHDTARARSRRRAQVVSSRSACRAATVWLPRCLGDGAPLHTFSPENIYLSRSAANRARVREKRSRTAMLTACFPAEELRAAQHRGDGRQEHRALTGRLMSTDLSSMPHTDVLLKPPRLIILLRPNVIWFICARVHAFWLFYYYFFFSPAGDMSGPTGQSTLVGNFAQHFPLEGCC